MANPIDPTKLPDIRRLELAIGVLADIVGSMQAESAKIAQLGADLARAIGAQANAMAELSVAAKIVAEAIACREGLPPVPAAAKQAARRALQLIEGGKADEPGAEPPAPQDDPGKPPSSNGAA